MAEPGPSYFAPLIRPVRELAETVRGYRLVSARRDLIAAATVTVVAIPQAMAFAMIVGVPPIYGLYGAIVQGAVGGLFSSSRHLVTGPVNMMSLVAAAVAARLVPPDAAATAYLATVVSLTLITGVIQMGFAAARMGTLFRYVSHAVIVGFTAGAGILIMARQVPNFFGMPMAEVDDPLPGLLGIAQQLAPNLGRIDPAVLTIALVSLAVMLVCERISRFLPAPLLAVLVGGVIVGIFGWAADDPRVVQPLPAELPSLAVPQIDWVGAQDMLAGALALALIGLMEAVAISKSIAVKSQQRIRANQEFFAQGLSNAVSSFFSCFPGAGSFSRSALNYTAGAATRFSSLYVSVLIAAALLLLAPLGRYLPLASLAAILFVVAYHLIDWRRILKLIRTSYSDAAVCLATLVATLVTHLEYAIFLGVFLNVALYLRRASHLHMAEMVPTASGPFQEQPVHDRSGSKQIVFLQIEGDLFFALADELQDRLTAIGQGETKVVILRLKRTHSMDATVLHVLDQFVDQMHAKGGYVLLCGVRENLLHRLKAFGLADKIGRDNIFEASFGVFTSAKRALHRARFLLATSIDIERHLADDDELEAWAYEI